MLIPTNTAEKSPYVRFHDFDASQIPFHDGARVLDLCCGYGTPLVNQMGAVYEMQVVSLDYYIQNLDKIRYFSDRVQGNAIRLPFRDASFEAIFCGEMIAENPFFQEHPENVALLIKEISRVLMPRGLQLLANEFVFVVPEGFQEIRRSKHFSSNKVHWAVFQKP